MQEKNQMTYYCSVDGTTLRANSEEELTRQYQEHMRTMHDTNVSDEQAKQAVRQEMRTQEKGRY